MPGSGIRFANESKEMFQDVINRMGRTDVRCQYSNEEFEDLEMYDFTLLGGVDES